MERKKYQTPVTTVIPLSCGSIMELPVGSTLADESSLMGKEHSGSDWEDEYDANPWDEVSRK